MQFLEVTSRESHTKTEYIPYILGQTCNGLRLFVGRAKQHLSVLPGKIIPNDALYIVHAGKEMKFECNYEILVFKD